VRKLESTWDSLRAGLRRRAAGQGVGTAVCQVTIRAAVPFSASAVTVTRHGSLPLTLNSPRFQITYSEPGAAPLRCRCPP
jgi:hypothetical protein